MKKIIAAFLAATLCWGAAFAQSVAPSATSPIVGPGFVGSSFYSNYAGATSNAATVATLDTVVYLQPFYVRSYPLTAQALAFRNVVLGVNCAVKLAVWGSSVTTKRATGVPLAGSNTASTGCQSNNTAISVSITYTFQPNQTYWLGSAFSTGAAAPMSINGAGFTDVMGRTSLGASQNIGSLSAPYTYATDIMALDLTSATFTDVNSGSGVPVVWVQCAASC